MQPLNASWYCLIGALVFCPALMAETVFPAFNPVIIEPGDLLEQDITIDRRGDIRLEIRLLSPPDGAQLVVSNDGQLKLRWETGPVLPEQTQLMIQARNIDTLEVVETVNLYVRTADITLLSANPVGENVTISFNPIANQIVSAGRTVSVSMNAMSSDGSDPLIRIDRVPQNASFDKKPLGGYTFFWQTGEQDQGEHIFRVTARHPTRRDSFGTAFLTVVVGDPSRRRTIPADYDQ